MNHCAFTLRVPLGIVLIRQMMGSRWQERESWGMTALKLPGWTQHRDGLQFSKLDLRPQGLPFLLHFWQTRRVCCHAFEWNSWISPVVPETIGVTKSTTRIEIFKSNCIQLVVVLYSFHRLYIPWWYSHWEVLHPTIYVQEELCRMLPRWEVKL